MRFREGRLGQVAVYGAVVGGGGVTTTFDPVATSGGVTLSNGNLTATGNGGANFSAAVATIYKSTGKFYFEMTSSAGGVAIGLGIQNASAGVNVAYPGSDSNGIGWINDGRVLVNNSSIVSNIATWAAGNTMGSAVDLSNSKIWFRIGSLWNNDVLANQNPATNTGGISLSTVIAGPYTPAISVVANGDAMTANFGNTAYAQTAPVGFGNWV